MPTPSVLARAEVVFYINQSDPASNTRGGVTSPVPIDGHVTFTPRTTLERAVVFPVSEDEGGGVGSVLVTNSERHAIRSGQLVSADGVPGVWLPLGIWDVSFTLSGGVHIPPVELELTAFTETVNLADVIFPPRPPE